MSKRHWFRFWMANYLEGVRGLSDELVATYTKIFVKMYDIEGPLRFDDQQLKLLPDQDTRSRVWRELQLTSDPSLISRANSSDPPPAANGTMISTGRVG